VNSSQTQAKLYCLRPFADPPYSLYLFCKLATLRIKMIASVNLGHHRLFDNYDVLLEIFQHLAQGDLKQCRADLARAATCSKIFSVIALDVLWKDLDSEMPLFRLLPGFQKAPNKVWVSIFLCDSNHPVDTPILHRFYQALSLFATSIGQDSTSIPNVLDHST
jgi:hypothetical protein